MLAASVVQFSFSASLPLAAREAPQAYQCASNCCWQIYCHSRLINRLYKQLDCKICKFRQQRQSGISSWTNFHVIYITLYTHSSEAQSEHDIIFQLQPRQISAEWWPTVPVTIMFSVYIQAHNISETPSNTVNLRTAKGNVDNDHRGEPRARARARGQGISYMGNLQGLFLFLLFSFKIPIGNPLVGGRNAMGG